MSADGSFTVAFNISIWGVASAGRNIGGISRVVIVILGISHCKTLNSISETVFELGNEAGAGSAMKAVNQLLAGVHISVMAEALTFGISQGITPAKFIEVISKCAGTSWMLENRAPHIVDGDYTPHSSVNIWPKDLGIVLDVAKDAKFDAPIASAALKQFKTAVDMGLGLEDDAAVAKVYAKSANLSLPKKL